MEIYYCTSCRTRVSSVDIEKGNGLLSEPGKALCAVCARKLEAQAPSSPVPPAPARPGASHGTHRGTAAREPAISAPSRTRDSGRRSAAAPGRNSLFIGVLVGIIFLTLILLVVLIVRKPAPANPASSGVPVFKVEDEVPPGPAPRVEPETAEDLPRPNPLPEPAAVVSEPAAPAAADWFNLLDGETLKETGWKPDLPNNQYGEGFTFSDGVLRKPATAQRCRIKREIESREGFLEFEAEILSGGLDLELFIGPEAFYAANIDRSVGDGRHTFQLAITNRTVTWQMDGKPFKPAVDPDQTWKSSGRISLAFNANNVFRANIYSIRFQPAGRTAAFDEGTDLLAGTTLADAGWSQVKPKGTDYAVLEPGQGMRISSPPEFIRLEKKAALPPAVALEIDYTCPASGGWELCLLDPDYKAVKLVVYGGPYGRHKLRLEVRVPEAAWFIDGRPMAAGALSMGMERPLHGQSLIWIQINERTELRIHAMRYYALKTAEEVPWVSGTAGATLEAAGWKHEVGELWEPCFRLEDGRLIKDGSSKGARLDRELPIDAGEIAFTYDFRDGGSWVFIVYGEKDDMLYLGFDRRAFGRHDFRMKLAGGEPELFLDGRPAGAMPEVSHRLAGPLSKKRMRIRFQVPDSSALTITDFRYRPLPPGETVWNSIMQGATLQDAGWQFELDSGRFGEGMVLEEGSLKIRADADKHIRPFHVFDAGSGDVEVQFEIEWSKGGSWSFGIIQLPNHDRATQIEFNRNSVGRHTVHMIVKGTETTVTLDGRPAGTGPSGVTVSWGAKRPFKGQCIFRLEIYTGMDVAIRDVKWRPLP